MGSNAKKKQTVTKLGDVRRFDYYPDCEEDEYESRRWSIEAYFDTVVKEIAPLLDKMPRTIKLLSECTNDSVCIFSDPKGNGCYEVMIEVVGHDSSLGQKFEVSFKQ